MNAATDMEYRDFLDELDRAGITAPEDAAVAVLCVLEEACAGAARGGAGGPEAVIPDALGPFLHRCQRHRGRAGDLLEPTRLVERIAEHLDVPRERAVEVTKTVFFAVQRQLSERDADRLGRRLPGELRELWSIAGNEQLDAPSVGPEAVEPAVPTDSADQT